MKNNMKEINNIDNFPGWEKLASEEDFFNESNQDNKDEKVKDEKPKEEEDLFKNDEIENQTEEEKGEEKEEEEKEEEENEDEEEENEEYKFEEAVDNRIKEIYDNLPYVLKQLNKYAIEGGDINKFFNTLVKNNNSKINENLDLEDENNQELIVRQMLKDEGNDDDEIDTQIEYYKESGKLEMLAEKKFNKWKKKRKEDRNKLLKEQEEANKKERELLRKAKSKTIDFLSENKTVGELKFNKEDKRLLPSYMNDKTIKLQNGAFISQLQKELFYDLPNNEKAFIQLATLMKNRNKDGTFNFKNIIENTKTKVIKEVKENITRSKTEKPTKSKSNKKYVQKSLADYFE